MIGGKLWNIVYEIKRLNIDPKFIKFTNSEEISPYMELNFENMNYVYFKENEVNTIEVNPYFRYFEIFFRMFDENSNDLGNLRGILFNSMCHFLGELELRKGLTREDYYLDIMAKQIINDYFSEEFKNGFYKYFNKEEQTSLYYLILNMYRDGNCLEHFCNSISKIFKKSTIYDYTYEMEDLIIYIPNPETENNLKKYELLKTLFLPIKLSVRVFWKYHFIILGDSQLSIIGSTVLF